MLINTAVLGEIEISDDNIFDIHDGLFGFDENHKYALVTKQDDDVTLKWFQAVDSAVPCFVVFDPFEIINGYEPVLEQSDIKALNADEGTDLDFLVIAVVPEDITKITVNLKSPIIINRTHKIARQVILQNSNYPIRFHLIAQSEEGNASGHEESSGSISSVAVVR